jgi:GT2 family glycosyltransferase
MLAQEFPDVHFIQNPDNRGYTAPMNQALRPGTGRYLMQLNPDTLLFPGTIDILVEYMDAHPQVGIAGPKVLNADGTLQKPCRRGEPRPLAVAGYFSGLDRRFPNHKGLNEYLLGYMDEDQPAVVAGVSGALMLIRRAVIEQIGYLDERFFAYQEDADFCRRARNAGWQVMYLPQARLTHFGGLGGSQVQSERAIRAWHQSYHLYYHTHLAQDYPGWFNFLFDGVIQAKLGLALAKQALRSRRGTNASPANGAKRWKPG